MATEPSVSRREDGPQPPADAGAGGLPPLHELVPLVYEELHDLAHWQLGREIRNVTLQTTALVHEAYLKLGGNSRVAERGRDYFFAAAAGAMRQVLVDAARRRASQKRGGGAPAPDWVDAEESSLDSFASDFLDLDRALEQLCLRSPRHMRVVECRFFGGMSVEETASALGVSPRTIKADWALARAWLRLALDTAGAD